MFLPLLIPEMKKEEGEHGLSDYSCKEKLGKEG
jgi:hypothetical protein